VNEIELLIKFPLCLSIFDQKGTARRCPYRLDWTEVGPNDLGVRMTVCKFNRPLPCSSANINDILDVVWDRRDVELAIKC